jgi:sugar transferase (PEP-CTERM/EpsH1 system associated)
MEYGVIKQVNGLDPARFTPMICALRFQHEVSRPLLHRRVQVYELHKPPGRDLRIVIRLTRLFRQQRVDIVHSHNWPTLLLTVAATALARVPVVIHGEHGREGQALPRRQVVVSRWLARRATHLVTVNEHLRRELIDHWRVAPPRVTAIPNGVDLDRFGGACPPDNLRRELGLATDDRVIMNAGGLRRVKDHPTLLRAFARVAARVQRSRLLLVGSDYGTGVQGELDRLAAELGIRERVCFAGVRHDVHDLLALADVYVNSSRFEGMSNTILEAMASRKPVVATAVGGNPELVSHGVTGYLVSPGDDETLAERILQLLTEDGLAGRLGATGRKRVECDHDLQTMVRAYSDLYEETLTRRRSKATVTSRQIMKQ